MDKHHMIPKYAGGSNESSNLISVSRTCHVMWHFANWTLWKRKEDYIAYRGLAGTLKEEELLIERSQLAGIKSFETKTGLFARDQKQRILDSSVGGMRGGPKMKNYIWVTDGTRNTRISKNSAIPLGWHKGVTRKLRREIKSPVFGNVTNWNEFQKEKGRQLLESRLKDLLSIDLSRRGMIARLSNLWGVSHTQVRRILSKI